MKKIILVEDDRFLSKMYYDKLSQEEDFTVMVFESGERALEAMRSAKPDLALLDILLPDINGVQVLRAMKQETALSTVPVLMLTNLNERDYINEALSLGVEGYLIKAHFTPTEVVDKIKQVLRHQEMKK